MTRLLAIFGCDVKDSRNSRFLLVVQYVAEGNDKESGSFVDKRSTLP